MTGLTDEEMMEYVSPRRPKPWPTSITRQPGENWVGPYSWQPTPEPNRKVMLATDSVNPNGSVDMPSDGMVLHQLDRLTQIGRMKMALTEAGRPDMAAELRPLNGNWWIPDDSAPDTAKLIKDYEREPSSFEFICRAHWVSIQRMRDYEVVDPKTGQHLMVSAARWQGEDSRPGWANLIEDMRKAMR